MGHPGPYLHQNANHQCGTEDGPQEGLILSYSDQPEAHSVKGIKYITLMGQAFLKN